MCDRTIVISIFNDACCNTKQITYSEVTGLNGLSMLVGFLFQFMLIFISYHKVAAVYVQHEAKKTWHLATVVKNLPNTVYHSVRSDTFAMGSVDYTDLLPTLEVT